MSSYNYQSSQLPPEGQWTTGFHDCCQDRSLCLKTCFCPCETMGEIAEIIDGGTTSKEKACIRYSILPAGWKGMYAAGYRRRLREMFKLPEEPHTDCIVHQCCCVCGLTQEYRELKNRGADPSLGWPGNLEKWNRQGIKEPPITTRMARC
ncbi:protein PLANT CADMIUM RESISTANCE 9-like [Amaranthus tricolor]|uniref:protein PLANT CADMIUM RESISTANCE 9-like n=1 Tax=Amaranthus tricolor TaxID=29722 RepID=UPI00258A9C15|nr:protein PLANT CADMIUM RESISTANCE 9-like [Amaranthus tricolor]